MRYSPGKHRGAGRGGTEDEMAAAAVAQISLSLNLPGQIQGMWAGSTGTARNLDADSQLVERCLGGDQGAWEQLIKTHGRRVYAICLRFTGKENEAQDLTQDVFLRVFKTLSSFRSGEGSFGIWLTRLT